MNFADIDRAYIIAGCLGLGAVILCVFVFTAAARRYVSNEERPTSADAASTWSDEKNPLRRDRLPSGDRRSGNRVEFPLTVNGTVIPCDRRQGGDNTG